MVGRKKNPQTYHLQPTTYNLNMLFNYKALDEKGERNLAGIEAVNVDIAISSLQRRGLIISQINVADGGSFLERRFSLSEFQIRI